MSDSRAAPAPIAHVLASGVALLVPAGCVQRPLELGELPACWLDGEGTTTGGCFEDEFTEFEVSIEPLHVLAGDFSGDANLEIIAVGRRGGPIGAELWPGSDAGPVGPSVDPIVTGCSAYPLAGPLLASGRDDLLFSTCMPQVSVYPGGENGFGAPVSIELPGLLRSTVIADMEGDGDIDLVVLGEDATALATLSVILREGDGSFAVPSLQPLSTLSFDPSGIRPADFNGDGLLDLALRNAGAPNGLGYVLGVAPAVFAEPVRLTTDLEIQTLVAADFDGDGDQDLAYSDDDVGTVCIWIVDEFPEPAPRCWKLEAVIPTHMAAGDLDDDGVAEVAFADSSAAQVWIWDVDLAADVPILLPLTTPVPADLVDLVDLQGDGALDVLAGHLGSRSFSIRLAIP